jgi:hypothetical protein
MPVSTVMDVPMTNPRSRYDLGMVSAPKPMAPFDNMHTAVATPIPLFAFDPHDFLGYSSTSTPDKLDLYTEEKTM